MSRSFCTRENLILLDRPNSHTSVFRTEWQPISVWPSGESHLFAANVSQQEQLRGVSRVELSPINKVEPARGILLKRARLNWRCLLEVSWIQHLQNQAAKRPEMNTYEKMWAPYGVSGLPQGWGSSSSGRFVEELS